MFNFTKKLVTVASAHTLKSVVNVRDYIEEENEKIQVERRKAARIKDAERAAILEEAIRRAQASTARSGREVYEDYFKWDVKISLAELAGGRIKFDWIVKKASAQAEMATHYPEHWEVARCGTEAYDKKHGKNAHRSVLSKRG